MGLARNVPPASSRNYTRDNDIPTTIHGTDAPVWAPSHWWEPRAEIDESHEYISVWEGYCGHCRRLIDVVYEHDVLVQRRLMD